MFVDLLLELSLSGCIRPLAMTVESTAPLKDKIVPMKEMVLTIAIERVAQLPENWQSSCDCSFVIRIVKAMNGMTKGCQMEGNKLDYKEYHSFSLFF